MRERVRVVFMWCRRRTALVEASGRVEKRGNGLVGYGQGGVACVPRLTIGFRVFLVIRPFLGSEKAAWWNIIGGLELLVRVVAQR